MSSIDLNTLLMLVGPLDDSAAPNSASARFRDYLNLTPADFKHRV